jgi:hypothetical protein
MTEYIIHNNYVQYRNHPTDNYDDVERFIEKVKRFLTFSFFVLFATTALYISLNFIYYQQGLQELAIEAQLEQGRVAGIQTPK